MKLITDKKYTIEDAIQYLMISRATLHRLLQRGDIASLKLGRHRYFLGKHLKAYETSCLQPVRKNKLKKKQPTARKDAELFDSGTNFSAVDTTLVVEGGAS